jgi:hypothetical protein
LGSSKGSTMMSNTQLFSQMALWTSPPSKKVPFSSTCVPPIVGSKQSPHTSRKKNTNNDQNIGSTHLKRNRCGPKPLLPYTCKFHHWASMTGHDDGNDSIAIWWLGHINNNMMVTKLDSIALYYQSNLVAVKIYFGHHPKL